MGGHGPALLHVQTGVLLARADVEVPNETACGDDVRQQLKPYVHPANFGYLNL
jgi:hypothetical protein